MIEREMKISGPTNCRALQGNPKSCTLNKVKEKRSRYKAFKTLVNF